MGQKKKKLAKGRLDKFYYLAKEQGYRSRAAYKLIQLNKKYNFLGSAKACLDLCAAPGGWMQVASKYMPVSSLIVGVDLVPIRQVRNCVSLAEDITTQKCRQEIKKALKTWKVDVCLHDGAPNMGTSWVQDAYQQAELTLHALKLATEFLNTGGWFVTKVFRGPDYNSLIYVFNKLFKKVESTKPQASRNVSAEIFVVCQGFINPKKIDPKLLDPKFVFKEIQDAPKKVDLDSLSNLKQKRNRVGYEDNVNLLYRKAFVSDFISSTEHLRLLANVNEFEFDESSKLFLNHPSTTEDIKGSLKDVKVLGKFDFAKLIKWRKEMIQFKEELDNPKDDVKEEEEEEKKPMTMEEMDESLEEQMKLYMQAIEKKKRKEKKRANEKKRDLQKKIQLQMHFPGDSILENEQTDLYSLKGKDKDFGVDLNADKFIGLSDSEDEVEEYEDDDDQDFDNDEYLEQQIDVQYNNYLNRIKKRDQFEVQKLSKSKVKKFSLGDDEEEEEDEMEVDSDEENDNELLKSNKRKKPSPEASANIFFDQGLFGGLEKEDEEDKDEIVNPLKKAKKNQAPAKPTKVNATTTTPTKNGKKKSKYQTAPGEVEEEEEEEKLTGDNEFEVVPMEKDIEYESDDDKDTEDSKINTLALGQFLLRKKSRDDLYDSSFNRYTFNDQELPLWFTDDENRHNQPQTPITKEMVSEIRKRIKDIDSRPIKKVAEAKARKKYKLTKKLEKAKDKANSIVDNPEMTNREKVRAIEKVYSGTDKKSKDKKIIMIARKGKTAGGGSGRYKMVDKRMKKDLKIQKAKDKRAGKKSAPKKNK